MRNREAKSMDVNKILEDLRRERTQLEEAILSLERLAAGGKRRGRPPAWIVAAQQQQQRGPGRPPGSKNKKTGR
ncbi:MAG TPA: hypothetical protein VHB50_07965, partial [Bryobacteraceae bacterium]|nr:hypothetical protein [Bryobacteraceae bacterium]